jgi:hypothetical protein
LHLQAVKMRSSTASLILAFCAMLAVQAAPTTNLQRSVVSRGSHDFEYTEAGDEVEKRGTHDFEYTESDDEIEDVEKRGTHDFEYTESGDEIEDVE